MWASLPIPFLAARQRMILYQMVPRELREAYFPCGMRSNTAQSAGLLLGGYLADFCV